jgi:MFS family permease
MTVASGALGGVLGRGPFRRFWIGFSVSAVGDAMTRTALVWYVLQATHSAPAVGLLILAYAGPVSVGGLLAGHLLDRFDPRAVMVTDCAVRGLAVASVPAAFAAGHLLLWHVYAVAAVYGLLFMIGLAGTPTLIPTLVGREALTAANSLETLGFTVSAVAGPALAGFVIAGVGAPYALLPDAASYGIFAAALATLHLRAEPRDTASPLPPPYRMVDAFRLLLVNRVLLATTLMFMAFNAGMGFAGVWVPVEVAGLAGGHGSELYGLVLAVGAAGSTAGALAAGALDLPLSVGRLICLAQVLAGLGLGVALLGRSVWWIAPALFLVGFFSAPMTAWAQTLRMRVIPPPLRGRSFALLRTMMQSSTPGFSGIGGVLLPALGLPAMIALSVALIALPGLAGSRVRELVTAD